MSVQSEISRISSNVAAALAAIAEKGVSVPSGSKSDALASLIASIEAGGGGGTGGDYELLVGEFVAAEDVTLPTKFDDSANFTGIHRTDYPIAYAYWLYGSKPGGYAFCEMFAANTNESDSYKVLTSYYPSSGTTPSVKGYILAATSGSGPESLGIIASSTTVKLFAGQTYKWFVLYPGGGS